MNRQTKQLRDQGLSLRFNHGVDFSHMGSTRHEHPEFTLKERPFVKGRCVDSSKERKAHGTKPYNS